MQEEFEDTKGIIRIRNSKDRQHNGQTKKDRRHNGQTKKDRQHNGQTKKDRQHNGQTKKDKRTNNDLQNITHKTKTKLNTRFVDVFVRRLSMC